MVPMVVRDGAQNLEGERWGLTPQPFGLFLVKQGGGSGHGLGERLPNPFLPPLYFPYVPGGSSYNPLLSVQGEDLTSF